MKKRLAILLTILLCMPIAAESISFNADSAYATIEHLSVTIGPRPVGSQNEQEALRWVKDRFVRFGADSAYIIPFTNAPNSGSSINTQSGVAVGIFKGETDTSIVIGGHVDSVSPNVPGANDNASGLAVSLELARVWSNNFRHYTLIFVAFGGEERGLFGSEHFVKQYAHIDSVALMFSLDMAGCDDDILILFDLKDIQTPKWLIRDAFRIDREQRIHRLVYWPHFNTLNMVDGGAGSDHIPFLEKDIPAIDFTTGLNQSPIHTPQDDITLISIPMLAEYGKLIHNLLLHYQKTGIPTSSTERYMLLPVFGFLFFVPIWAMVVCYCAALGFGGLTLFTLLKRKAHVPQGERARFSGLKLVAVFVVILLSNQAGQFVIQLITGMRHPWIVNVWPYIRFGVLLTVLGAWLAARIARRWRFSDESKYYAIRLLLLISAVSLLFVLGSLRLAMYPALMLILVSLALLVHRGFLKITFLILALIPPFQLIFNEAFPDTARIVPFIQFMTESPLKSYFIYSLLQLLLLLPVLPLLFGLFYLNTELPGFRILLMKLRKPIVGLFVLITTIISGYFLIQQPSYNAIWKPFLYVNAAYDMQTQKSRIQLVGTEYLKGARVVTDSLEMEFSALTLKDTLATSFTADWISISGHEIVKSGVRDTVSLFWQMNSSHPWQEASLTVETDTSTIDTAWSDLKLSFQKNQVKLRWLSDPPELIDVRATLIIKTGSRLIRKIEGKYGIVPIPLQVESELMNVRYRTEVTFADTVQILLNPSEIP